MSTATDKDTGRISIAQRLWRRIANLPRQVRRLELPILFTLAVLAALLWGFIELAEDVVERERHWLDEQIILALRSPGDRSDPIGPRWLEEVMRDFTALGGMAILVGLTLAVAGFFALQRRWRMVLLLVIAVGGGQILSGFLKYLFSRPRPDLVPHGSHVYTSSFPSGHSTMSAITYLTLAALLMRAQSRKREKLYFLTVAILMTISVGVSRVYLGVHWPTDVLAGWALGASWAIICWLAALWLQRHGKVEDEANSG